MKAACNVVSRTTPSSPVSPLKRDINSKVNRDVLAACLLFLPKKDFPCAFRVCKLWDQTVNCEVRNNPARIWKEAVIGPAEWRRYIGEPDAPQLSEEQKLNILNILNGPCPFWRGKRVCDTHMLVFVPRKINDEPLNLNRIGELVQQPLSGNSTKYSSVKPEVTARFGDQPIKAGWYLVTKTVIPGSRNKSYRGQMNDLEAFRDQGYEPPTLAPLITTIFMRHFLHGRTGYGRDPVTLSRIAPTQKVTTHGQECPLVVGGFGGADGLCIDINYFGFCNETIGMGVQRQILPS